MLFRSRSLTILFLIPLTASLAFTTTACGKKKPKPEVRVASTTGGLNGGANGFGAGNGFGSGAPDAYGLNGSGSMAGGPGGAGSGSYDATGSLANNGSMSGVENGQFTSELEMVHFDYDSAEVSEAWMATLDKHAEWIAANSTVQVQVQGHCDERGTEEYNVALGQRRADAVREYLVGKGVNADRLTTISYGKQRPLNFEDTEDSNALNRRAMFLVYETEGPAVASAQ
jgi:peptidoglycan-associated lipoprotein